MSALDLVADWPVPTVSAAVVGPEGIRAQIGPVTHQFALASVTKPLVARAAQVALEEGAIDLATPAGPPGSTVEHLLAHASGLSLLSDAIIAKPGTRRVYSNYGFAVLAHAVAAGATIEFGTYLREAVLEPLGMGDTVLPGGAETAGYGGISTVNDLVAFVGDLLRPRIVTPETHQRATSVVFPGLDGVLPGYGVQRPNDWGLGFEIKGTKIPHWTGAENSPATYGHFGQAGTFIWVDPAIDLALVVLTDRSFDGWANQVWPQLSDAVLAEFG
ncbi:serine hydrolase domain-containing protein [Mycobacteroides sp. LB1]|uniref:serine hydrolase domain-containing protein n=1 Tax=Mycobacteroides sp. LB1 TaxID=2750814 RepID=UPI0015DFF069|nr:beta-lactamase family protein [Mycobacteroides sp. LB1]